MHGKAGEVWCGSARLGSSHNGISCVWFETLAQSRPLNLLTHITDSTEQNTARRPQLTFKRSSPSGEMPVTTSENGLLCQIGKVACGWVGPQRRPDKVRWDGVMRARALCVARSHLH